MEWILLIIITLPSGWGSDGAVKTERINMINESVCIEAAADINRRVYTSAHCIKIPKVENRN